MRRYAITAFLTGAAVMIGEIAAARAIAPHFGTSIIVWTNVIGIILVALSIGYWLGGKLSERCVPTPSSTSPFGLRGTGPSPSLRGGVGGGAAGSVETGERVLGAIIALAGVLLIIPAFATRWIAGTIIADLFRLGSWFLVVLIGSFVAVILLFALPIALLGMVSPFLVKLACTRENRTSSPLLRQEGVRGSYDPTVTPPNLPLFQGEWHVGATAGKLYAISTIGSLVGTFLPTLVLLPTFGTRRTMLLAAAVLIALGVWLATRRRAPALLGVLVLVLVLVPDRPIPWFLGGKTIAQRDSRYQLLRVVDVPLLGQEGVRGSYAPPVTPPNLPLFQGEGSVNIDRFLVFNEGFGIQSRGVFDPAAIEGYFPITAAIPSLFLPSSTHASTTGVVSPGARSSGGVVSVARSAAWGALGSVATEPEEGYPPRERGATTGAGATSAIGDTRASAMRSTRILILGNAGGTIANLMQRFFSEDELDITGVELDPAVTAITAAHFPPPTRVYPIVHADSRVFLRGTDARYDVIVADAYTSQLTIPPHLATREFFDLIRTRLTPGGVLVANVNAPSRYSVLLRTIEQTVAAAFPHVVIGKAGETWNYLILASATGAAPASGTGSASGGSDSLIQRLDRLRELQFPESARAEIQRFLETAEPVTVDPKQRSFTDDWAPLELFTDLEIFEAIRLSSS